MLTILSGLSRIAILRDRYAGEDIDKVETQLTNRDLPSRRLETQVQNDLSGDAIDGTEKDPSRQNC